MNGARTLFITGTASYTGATTVSNGTVHLSGSISGGGAVTVAGGTLMGNGSVSGGINVLPGGTLAPGASVGKLTAGGAVSLAGTNLMEIDPAGDTNDVLQAASIAYGGTLSLSVLPGTLQAGDTFKLYNATSYSGSFSLITPATPGTGLRWGTGALNTTGTIRIDVVPQPGISEVVLSGSNLTVKGTNGLAGAEIYLRTSTDISVALSSWTLLATNVVGGAGTVSFTIPVDFNEAQRYYALQAP